MTNARHAWTETAASSAASEITDIIPFNEFGDLADLDFRENCAFDRESQVIHAPELDDLHDTDDLIPLRLAVPSEFRPNPREERRASHAYRDSHTDTSDGVAATDIIDISGRRGLHRKQDVPVKGRLMVAAMAVGATAAGAYSMANASEKAPTEAVLAADQSAIGGGLVTGSVDGMQIVTVAPVASAAIHSEELANGAAFAQDTMIYRDECGRYLRKMEPTSIPALTVESMGKDSAVILVLANERITNSTGAKDDPRSFRFRVSVARDGDQMKISKVEFVL